MRTNSDVLSYMALLESSFTAQKTIFCTGKYYRSFSVISLVGLSPTCLKKAKCDLLSDKKKRERGAVQSSHTADQAPGEQKRSYLGWKVPKGNHIDQQSLVAQESGFN